MKKTILFVGGVFLALISNGVSPQVWRGTDDEVAATPHWMIEPAQCPVNTNEVVVANAPKNMTLFLLIGQSNMAGRGKLSPGDKKPIPRCLKLNRDGQWVEATSPIHFDRVTAGFGIANAFVRRYLEEHPSETVGLIPCAVGGSTSVTWSPEDTAADPIGTNYRRAMERGRLAQKNGRIAGILWHHGEADVGRLRKDPTHRDRYVGRLVTLAEVLRRKLDCPDAPFLIGEVGTLPVDSTAMNPVLAAAAAAIPKGGLVHASDLKGHLSDGVHFDTPSYRILGERYYEVWKSLKCDLIGRKPLRFLFMADHHVESDFVQSHGLSKGEPVYTMWKAGNHAALVETYRFINEDPFCREIDFALFGGDQLNTGYTKNADRHQGEVLRIGSRSSLGMKGGA